jgi:predicted nucleic acid-binding protein
LIYLDTSSLLKLLHNEPESTAVQGAVAAERDVVISTLAQLEARVQLKAAWRGGDYGKARYQALVNQLDALSALAPFRLLHPGGGLLETAIRQDREAGSTHLRALDRLHLAAMEELGARRLMTHDLHQATAARQLGFEVVSPGLR